MASFAFTRRASHEITMSEDIGRDVMSGLTEGSNRILGSVRDAKRGIVGGLSSTLNRALSLVSSPDLNDDYPEHQVSSVWSARAPENHQCKNVEISSPELNSASSKQHRPPKPPPPTQRQNSDPKANGFTKNGSKLLRQNTTPTKYHDGSTDREEAKISQKKFIKPNHSDFKYSTEDVTIKNEENLRYEKDVPDIYETAIDNLNKSHDFSVDQNHYQSRQNDSNSGYENTNISSSDTNTYPPNMDSRTQPTQRRIHPPKASMGGGESDADSESTGGCDDDRGDVDDFLLDSNSISGQVSESLMNAPVNAEDSECMNDPQSQMCQEFMKHFIEKVFSASDEISFDEKAQFGELCRNPTGRFWFARCINSQRVQGMNVSEMTLLNMVQFFSLVLFECNDSDDFGPAKTLMNMCFTFYHEDKRGRKLFLYSLLKDQSIWQSQRFWSAAFFYSVQQERATRPIATSGEQSQTQNDDMNFQENIMFGQLGTFTCNMRSLGVSKEHCLEFLRKQSTIANLSSGQIRMLRENMEGWTDAAPY